MGGLGSGGQNKKEIKWIEQECIYPELGKCHICTSHSKNPQGYPNFKRNNVRYLVVRYLYEQEHGRIPDGMQICHKCDTPGCISLNHVFLGTNSDNVYDKVQKKRHSYGENHKRSKLTEKDVIAIMKDMRQQKEIAKDYSVSPQAIGKIKRKERWKYLWL